MTKPTGNGEVRGMESADGLGTPLPGTRPSRARANEARNPIVWNSAPKDQGGFGKEDMKTDISFFGMSNEHASDCFGPPVDLMAMGDPGEAFGGS